MTRIYNLLMKLLPRAIRLDHGVEMRALFDGQLAELRGMSRVFFGVRECSDLIASAAQGHAIRFRGDFPRDLRWSLRALARSPGFTGIAVLTLGLGIGAASAAYSIVDAWIIRPLPYPHAERLVTLFALDVKKGYTGQTSSADYYDWAKDNKVFESMSAWTGWTFNISAGNEPERVYGARVSGNFFRTLGVQPAFGRDFRPEDDRPGAPRVAILTDELWKTKFGSERNLAGKMILTGGEPAVVAGVLPANFHFPLMGRPKIFTPLELSADERNNRSAGWLNVLARRKPGVSVRQGRIQMEALVARVARTYPETNANTGVRLLTLADDIGEHAGNQMVQISFGMMFCVLLVICSNVANLMLVRTASRQRETAIRQALGAIRWRLVRQSLTESVLVFLAGAVFGVAVANATMTWITNAIPFENRGYLRDFGVLHLNIHVLLFMLGITLFTALLFGLYPAVEGARLDLNAFLKEGMRSSGSHGAGRFRNLLTGGEMALALALLAGACLLARSVTNIVRTDPGFRSDHLLAVDLDLPEKEYSSMAKVVTFYEEAVKRLRSLPSVISVAASSQIPFGGSGDEREIAVEGRPAAGPGEQIGVFYSQAMPGYFITMGIPILAGRAFTEADNDTSKPVAVINDEFARLEWPHESPLGRHIRIGAHSDTNVEIVGVVRSVQMYNLKGRPMRQMYVPFRQTPARMMYLAVRTEGDPEQVLSPLRSVIWSIDRSVPVPHARPMQNQIADTYAPY